MSVHGDEQIGRVLGGRYRLVAAVGTGASATVYLADDVQLRRRVAVKVLHPYLADDARVPAPLPGRGPGRGRAQPPQHHGGLRLGGRRATSPTSCSSTSAAAACAPCSTGAGCSARRRPCWSASRPARGLDYAHRRGFVHRDIKPANLLFGEDGRLRIADFGLARAIAEAAWTEPAGVLLGTARYASPEQAKGEPVDGKSDVYSLALTLVESVTGEVPFAADTTVATLMNRLDRLMPVSAELGPLAAGHRAGRPAGPGRALDGRRAGPGPHRRGREAAAAGPAGPGGRRARR